MFFNLSLFAGRRIVAGLLFFMGSLAATVVAGPTNIQHVVDFDGNGRTDFAVGRLVNGPQIRWIYFLNPSGVTAAADWGLEGDEFVPEDYDGDFKTDIAVWRHGVPATFYILNSQTNTVRAEVFGQTDDDPTVVGDYNNDGRADLAVFRSSAGSWFYRTTPNGATTQVVWGSPGDFPAPGDYDGDGSHDFVVQRNNGVGQSAFWRLFSGGGHDVVTFGLATDLVVPGDYDGDGKTDITVVRRITSGPLVWFWLPSGGGGPQQASWGLTATDRPAQGDYDGDGKTDLAIWRSSGVFWIFNSSTLTGAAFNWGTTGDYPIANYNVH